MPYAIASLILVALVLTFVLRRLANPHALARIGAVERLRRVLKRSPDARDRKDRGGETPLMHAAKYDESATTQLLLEAGADANAACDGGGTALMLASAFGCNTTVPLLLKAGAHVNAADQVGVTALHHAAAAGFADTARLLVAAGADASLRDAAGRTPGEFAAERGFTDVAAAVTGDGQRMPAQPPLRTDA